MALILICLPAFALADSAKLLLTDDEAFLARLALGNRIEKEVNYATYELDQSRAGMLVLAGLCRSAREGKTARLLVDGWTLELSRAILAYVTRECGVQVKIYHPLDRPLSQVTRRPFSWKTQRMHMKLFIRDGIEVIAGSRNTQKRYFTFKGQPSTGQPRSSDIDFFLRSDSVRDANAFFLKIFNSGEALAPAGLDQVTPEEQARAGRRMERFARLLVKWNSDPALRARIDAALENPIPVKSARFYHNDSGPRGNKPGVDEAVLQVLDKARPGSEILLESPYLLLTEKLKRAMKDAVGRDCSIRILTNDKNEGADWPTTVAYKDERGALAALGRTPQGRKLWILEKQRLSAEHDPEGKLLRPTTLHGKAATNGEWLAAGSANLDPRSYDGLNLEDMWLLESPELSAQLADQRLKPLMRSGQVKEAARNTPTFVDACKIGFFNIARNMIRPHLLTDKRKLLNDSLPTGNRPTQPPPVRISPDPDNGLPYVVPDDDAGLRDLLRRGSAGHKRP